MASTRICACMLVVQPQNYLHTGIPREAKRDGGVKVFAKAWRGTICYTNDLGVAEEMMSRQELSKFPRGSKTCQVELLELKS
ncbi:unnamed protein product [Prunus armeniaca]|uniref:Uncharacterized protein n=1 Tax=Prunus armeniaca TaxID=36596 RepID=A0A6J5TIB6_PRUAR|nr:unnamed protein product [Prunus armeniaca]